VAMFSVTSAVIQWTAGRAAFVFSSANRDRPGFRVR
jgi:hypothetical protein